VAAESRTMYGPGQDMVFQSELTSAACPTLSSARAPAASTSFQRDSAFQAGSVPGSQPDQPPPTVGGVASSPTGSRSPISPVSQPNNGFSQSFAPSFGSASTAPLRSRVETPGFASGDSLQVPRPSDGDSAAGQAMASVSANVAGPLASTVLFGQVLSAAFLATTQVGSILSNDVVATARSESPGDASAHGARVTEAGSVNNLSTRIGRIATPGTHSTLQSARPGISALLAEAKLDDFPGPNGDDLMAVVLPFDRESLERAVDHFFHQLDELEVRDLVGTDLTHIVFLSLGLATSVAALEVARRRLRRWTAGWNRVRVRDTRVMSDDLGFPDLPGSWSSRLT
jgi:hypothetical protein